MGRKMKRENVDVCIESNLHLDGLDFDAWREYMEDIEKTWDGYSQFYFELAECYDDLYSIECRGIRLENDHEYNERMARRKKDKAEAKKQFELMKDKEYLEYIRLNEKYG